MVAGAERLVLPGVGAAAPAMAALRSRGLDRAAGARSTAPLIGVCLGMQLLFGHSDEGDVDCLGLLAGNVIAIDWAERVPHMGWNDVVGSDVAAPGGLLLRALVRRRLRRSAGGRPHRDRRPPGAGGRAVGPAQRRRSSTPRRARPTAAAMLERWLAA